MANNSLAPGRVLTLTAPSGGVVSGTFYLIGSLLVCALTTAAAGAKFSAGVGEVYIVPKATGQAWTECLKLYWDDTAKKFTSTASGNTLCACAVVAAASGDTTGTARLNGTV